MLRHILIISGLIIVTSMMISTALIVCLYAIYLALLSINVTIALALLIVFLIAALIAGILIGWVTRILGQLNHQQAPSLIENTLAAFVKGFTQDQD